MRRKRSFGAGVLALTLLVGGGWAAQAQTAERVAAQQDAAGAERHPVRGTASAYRSGTDSCQPSEPLRAAGARKEGVAAVRAVPARMAVVRPPAVPPSERCAPSTA